MKAVLVVLLLALAMAQDDPVELCVREKCPDEVAACEKNAFCAIAATKCSNQCASDYTCLVACANKSGNKLLIALYIINTIKIGAIVVKPTVIHHSVIPNVTSSNVLKI
jgi:hypothetical protein